MIIQYSQKKRIRKLRKLLGSGKKVVLDIETSGLFPTKLSKDCYIVSIGFLIEDKTYCVIFNHTESEIFEDFAKQKNLACQLFRKAKLNYVIAHNGKFDSKWIEKLFGFSVPIRFDTMLASHILDENLYRHGLKDLSTNLLGADDYDLPLEEKQGKGPLKRHILYLEKDLRYCHALYLRFYTKLKDDKLVHRFFKLFVSKLTQFYRDIEMEGLTLDKNQVKKAIKFYEKEGAKLEKKLAKYNVNYNSPKQVGELFFETLGLKSIEKTKTGNDSVSESVLKRLDHPVATQIIEVRKVYKLLNTFLYPWVEKAHRGRIHPSFKVTGTVTGRPSCEKPNIQQTPRNPVIRSCIYAPKKWELVACDLAQAELRIAAELSRDKTMIGFFETGVDPHSYIVNQCFGIENPTKEQRKKGKAINFGYLYGMWWKNFIVYARDKFDVKVSDKEAKQSRATFFATYAQLETWHNRQKNFAKANGYVSSLIGRKRRLPDACRGTQGYDFKRDEALRQAINSPVQSLASDWTLSAGVEMSKTFDYNHFRMCGTIHDELLFYVDKKELSFLLPEVKNIMEGPKIIKRLLKDPMKVKMECEISVGPWGSGTTWTI